MFPGDAQSLEAALLEKCCQIETRQSKAAVFSLCPSLSHRLGTEGWRGGWKGTGHTLPLTPLLTHLVPALSPGQ